MSTLSPFGLSEAQFTVQIYPVGGNVRVPDDTPLYPPDPDVPMWRCSGCFMPMRIHLGGRLPTKKGRPIGNGCSRCRRAHWTPGNPQAERHDFVIGHPTPAVSMTPRLKYMAAMMLGTERAAQDFVRHASSCEDFIRKAITTRVKQAVQDNPDVSMWATPRINVRFLDEIQFNVYHHIAEVTCAVGMVSPNVRLVRYRWDQ